jgi:Secretion system C-terminal sorting domain
MKTYIYIILLLSSVTVTNINAQIKFERLENIPEDFVERYNQEYHEYNPLHVGDLWQYYFNDYVGYVSTRVVADSIINEKRYFKKISYWYDLLPDRSDFVSWERNDSISGNSYMLDFEDIDEDGDTLEELPLDSLELPDHSFYTSYKYSYKLKFGNDPYPGPKNALIDETFWAIIWGDTVLSRLVQYSELFHEEYIANKFGMWKFWDELTPERSLTGAIINGKTYGTIVNIKENNLQVPSSYILEQNYPNPFNSETIIRYFLPIVAKIKIYVYDILGNEIDVLVDDIKSSGYHVIHFSGNNLSSGIYFYSLITETKVMTKSMILLK